MLIALVDYVYTTDSVIGRVHLLSYGCAYTRRSGTPASRPSTSTSGSRGPRRIDSETVPSGCQSVTSTVSDALGGLFDRLHSDDVMMGAEIILLLTSSDVSGQLCHCVTDDCNSAWPTITGFSGCCCCWATSIIIIIISTSLMI